jgi:hypothetical protein
VSGIVMQCSFRIEVEPAFRQKFKKKKLMFLDRFDVLMLKIDFKKNIILMHFQAKSTLKSILYHTPKHLYMVFFKSVFHYKIHQNKKNFIFFFIFYIITSKLSKSTKKYFNLMLFQVKRAKKRTSCTPK